MISEAKYLNISRAQQAKSMWCWAASAEMVGTYGTSSSISQWDIVNFIWGPTYPNNSGDINQMIASVQYASNDTKAAKSRSKLLLLSKIKSKINSDKPMIARFGWNSGGGHAMVISGYKKSKIKCIDPWENNRTTYYTYISLRDGGSFQSGKGKVTHTIYY